MPSPRIHHDTKDIMYFVTYTVKRWYYLFDRHNRFEILENSFVYCQQHKELKICAFVFMLNHLHYIGSAPDLIAVIRDMKKFLSKELQKNIIATEANILELFREEDNTFSIWQPGNHPESISSEKFFQQKLKYIHNNPVDKGDVHHPEDWKYSSACKIPTKIQISSFY